MLSIWNRKYEDRQAFIIHYPALSGKTRFIQKACQVIPGLHYVNWLDYILAKPDLPSLEKIVPNKFEKEILEMDKLLGAEVSAVIIDQSDPMFNTWDADEKQDDIPLIHADHERGEQYEHHEDEVDLHVLLRTEAVEQSFNSAHGVQGLDAGL